MGKLEPFKHQMVELVSADTCRHPATVMRLVLPYYLDLSFQGKTKQPDSRAKLVRKLDVFLARL